MFWTKNHTIPFPSKNDNIMQKKTRIEISRHAMQARSDIWFLIFKPDHLSKQNGVEQGKKMIRSTRKTVQMGHLFSSESS